MEQNDTQQQVATVEVTAETQSFEPRPVSPLAVQAEAPAVAVSPVSQIDQLLRMCIGQPGAIDQMRELLAVRKEYMAEEARMAYARARAAFRRRMAGINIPKNGVAKVVGEKQSGQRYEYTYPYAYYNDIVAAVSGPLGEEDLSFDFNPIEQTQTNMRLQARVRHAMGHVETFELGGPISPTHKSKIQDVGETLSYLQRYLIQIALGISTGDDKGLDPDTKASHFRETEEPRQRPQAQRESKPEGPASEAALRSIRNKAKRLEILESEVCKHFKLKKLEDLPMAKVNEALEWLENPG